MDHHATPTGISASRSAATFRPRVLVSLNQFYSAHTGRQVVHSSSPRFCSALSMRLSGINHINATST
jgi:hypothetical protein